MFVQVEISGHQFAVDYRGRVIEPTQSVEQYDNQFVQVPALLIERQDTKEIVVQPLKQQLYNIKVRRI